MYGAIGAQYKRLARRLIREGDHMDAAMRKSFTFTMTPGSDYVGVDKTISGFPFPTFE